MESPDTSVEDTKSRLSESDDLSNRAIPPSSSTGDTHILALSTIPAERNLAQVSAR